MKKEADREDGMKLLRAIGEIKEEYIMEAEQVKKISKRKKKESITYLAAAALFAAVVGAGIFHIRSTEPAQEEITQIANPFIPCNTMEEAEKISGLTLPLLDMAEMKTEIYAIKDELVEVIYFDADGEEKFRIRRGAGTEDVSGDYNIYSVNKMETIGGFEVTLKGEEAGYSAAVWTDGKCAYAIDAQDAPLQEDELRSMIEFLSQSME